MFSIIPRNVQSCCSKKIIQFSICLQRPCTASCSNSASSSSTENVRVRFAPSPTGSLHLGGLRTALLNFIFARKYNGAFIIRIEDTDQARLVPGAAEMLEDILNWTGLRPDESPLNGGDYQPYIQSQRLHYYKEICNELLEKGAAYRCFCSEDRLMLLKKEALRNREIPRYDRKCQNLTEKEISEKLEAKQPYAIRFENQPDLIGFNDMIYGDYQRDVLQHDGDSILMKSIGWPTYHLANVVDDHYMKISHVLRGEEWLNSTVKHLQIYRALNWKPPQFGHIPLLTDEKGAKLSKRHGDVFVEDYKNQEVYALSLINFLTKMGGGFKNRDEHTVYSLDELIDMFDISLLSRNRLKVKLDWMQKYNHQILQKASDSELVPKVREIVIKKFYSGADSLSDKNETALNDEYIEHAIRYLKPRLWTINELVSEEYAFIWRQPDKLKSEITKDYSNIKDHINCLSRDLGCLTTYWNVENLKNFLKSFMEKEGMKTGKLMQVLRVILSGSKVGPPIAEIMEILGKERVIARLNNFVK